MKKYLLIGFILLQLATLVNAAMPVWTFTPLTATTVSLPTNNTTTIQYRITNQSRQSHTMMLTPAQGITQVTTAGNCASPFTLGYQQFCTLTLQASGNSLQGNVFSGPVVCEQGSTLQCYQPGMADRINITLTPAVSLTATISVSGSPRTILAGGSTGNLTITNNSSTVTALNITSNFLGTALVGKITETGNTCASLAPSASCTLTYTSGGSVVIQTNFTIAGSNTNTVTAAIAIVS